MFKKNKNISKKKFVTDLIWIGVLMAISVLLILSVNRKNELQITRVEVKIKPIKGNQNLVLEKDIKAKFRNFLGYDIEAANIEDINPRKLEDLLEEDKRIKESEVFIDGKERLQIYIIQRQPIARVIKEKNITYYLDDEGSLIPLTKGRVARVPIVTGKIDKYKEGFLESEKPSNLKDIFKVCEYIQKDEFLNALVEQLDVNDNGDIVIIPKVGRQKVILGKAEDLENRFEDLKLIYKHALPRKGWNKYSVLNLKFDNMVFLDKDE